MRKLIINADDLGFSPAVNRAVLEGATLGTITAASLMVNMPYADEAVDLVKKHCPDLSLALHFTLTSGKPVTSPEEIPLLVDERGLFRHGFLGLWKNLAVKKQNDAFLNQVCTEFRSQFRRMEQFAQSHGLRFDHLDSHQHVHVLPGSREMFQQTADEHGLHLRVPRELFGSAERFVRRFYTWLPSGILKRTLLNMHSSRLRQRIGYFGILETGKIDKAAIQAILQVIRSLSGPSEVFELNIHPSTEEEETDKNRALCASGGDLAFHRSPWRQKEFSAIMDPELLSLAAEYGIQLTGFQAGNLPVPAK